MPAAAIDPEQFWQEGRLGFGGDIHERALSKFKRGRYGIPNETALRYLGSLASNAYTAGQGVTNRIERSAAQRGLSRSAAVLSAPQAGARTQADVFQQGALPFELANARFAEGQLQSDQQAGLAYLQQIVQQDLARRGLLLQQNQANKGGGGIGAGLGKLALAIAKGYAASQGAPS